MNKQCLKTTIVTVSLIAGSLISACANSGGQDNPSQDIMPGNTMRLTPEAEKDLTVKEKLSVVFAVDKKGKVHVFAPKDSTIDDRRRDLPPDNPKKYQIKHMNTITTFQTSNPKTCWVMHGTLRCFSW